MIGKADAKTPMRCFYVVRAIPCANHAHLGANDAHSVIVVSGTFEATLRAVTDDNIIHLNTACVTGTDEVYPKTCNDLSVEHRLP